MTPRKPYAFIYISYKVEFNGDEEYNPINIKGSYNVK